jgi:hypothetical protein
MNQNVLFRGKLNRLSISIKITLLLMVEESCVSKNAHIW